MDLLFEAYENTSTICEICETNTSKYKCPSCSKKTCGLGCIETHKKQTNCTGMRNRTNYISMKDYSENHFWSDIYFLEDMARKTDVMIRYNQDIRKPSNPKFKRIVQQARKRKIKLRFLPREMTRSSQNFTFYHSK
jgi:hypothetical protein